MYVFFHTELKLTYGKEDLKKNSRVTTLDPAKRREREGREKGGMGRINSPLSIERKLAPL